MEEILKAADEAELLIKKREASQPIIKVMMGIVKKFMQTHRVLGYGGTAINNLLPRDKQFYDPELDIPDYDFFSETPTEHAKMIADLLAKPLKFLAFFGGLGQNICSISWVLARGFVIRDGVCRVKS